MTGSPWAVVLAGGDGNRVAAMTRDGHGRVVPKQFWSFDGGRPCGWSDLGTPERLRQFLDGPPRARQLTPAPAGAAAA
jgi:hypothetical protein